MVILVSLLPAVVLMAIVAFTVRRFGRITSDLPLSSEWIDELSIDKYRPMMRLLDRRDLELLSSQPDYTPEMATEFREQRCKAFRGYLNSLNVDFARICTALNLLMAHSRQDRPDLAATLIRSRLMFSMGMAMLNVRLFFYRLGWCEGDASELVGIFDSMRLELRRLIPAPMAA